VAQAIPGVSEFGALVHEAARRTGGRVVAFVAAEGVTPNFHQGVITYRDRTVAVLCSRDDGSVAVAESYTEPMAAPVFVDEPDLVAVLTQFQGFRVLTKPEADQPFDPAVCPDVDPRDVRYWQPETVGSALFNHWD